MDKSSWWTYRIINGKACWYRGKRTIDKRELYWAPAVAAPGEVGQPAAAVLTTSPHSVAAEPTFDERWRSLTDDLNASLWLNPKPATQWSIGERQ